MDEVTTATRTATPRRPADQGGEVSMVIAGSGGAGVMTAGTMLLDAAARAGLYGLMVRSSGPQIRGGEAAALLRFSREPIESMGDRFDYLVAVDWMNLQRFADEIPLDPASVVFGDPKEGELPQAFARTGTAFVPIAFKAIAKSVSGGWPNMVALGLGAHLLGIAPELVDEVIAATLKKGGAALNASQGVAGLGRDAASDAGFAAGGLARALGGKSAAESADAGADAGGKRRWLITGNEAAGYGAVRGGVRFVAAYPITPATELLEWMAPALAKVGGVLVQAEDELASINMALGASYGGLASLTATAGPGLALMTEAIGLAVAAELPVVIVDVMRGGPSTGIPAKSEQSDISIATSGLHGDAPRLVIAPNSIADCLAATQWAVHLAESLQAPAIVLSDQFFGQTRAVIDRPADLAYVGGRVTAPANSEGYRRYADTPDGVSPMAIPGTPGTVYTADGLEHNERGIPSSQSVDHKRQLDKRERKLDLADYGTRWADVEGEGDLVVVTLGSATGPVREGLARAAAEGLDARLVSIRLLSPARPQAFAQVLAGARRVLVIEQNHSAQFLRYLRSVYDFDAELRSFCHPGPLPIRPAEVYRAVTEWSQS
ncbi:MAG: 2-oxoacid:acceptor oxidoreductase subunit alpha [Burkholderiaceae bacterium]|nr:2-oxoacid:acceptor oxidoreductase subunit alpha [Burkholderiaceae bacterium]